MEDRTDKESEEKGKQKEPGAKKDLQDRRKIGEKDR